MNGVPPVFIQAVPFDQRRVKNVKKLKERLEGRGTSVTVVWDQDRSAFKTYKRVLRSMVEQAPESGTIIMEDDVVVCEDWEEQIQQSIRQYPNEVIRYWTNNPEDQALGTRWVEGKDFATNLCVYYPQGIPAAFLEYVGDNSTKFHEDYHDLLFGRFLSRRKQSHIIWVPSLVQHMPWESTVMPNRSKKRQSYSFRMKP